MRQKKDKELTGAENRRIEQLETEIAEKREQLQIYEEKSHKIQKKVNIMKKYDEFLEKVKDNNQDEFGELQDILSREEQLSKKNIELQDTQKMY